MGDWRERKKSKEQLGGVSRNSLEFEKVLWLTNGMNIPGRSAEQVMKLS